MTVREAFTFFRGQPKVQARLKRLIDVGLDYLRLGQPANTLSGGEAQRLKLAGLHVGHAPRPLAVHSRRADHRAALSDIVQLLDCFDALLAVGHSLIVVEHNLQMMKAADYIIDLGPGAADEGGQVVAQGTPEAVARVEGIDHRPLSGQGPGRRANRPPQQRLVVDRRRRLSRSWITDRRLCRSAGNLFRRSLRHAVPRLRPAARTPRPAKACNSPAASPARRACTPRPCRPRFAFVDRGPGASLLAEAIVPEPCFWTPEMPHLYQAEVQLRRGGRRAGPRRRGSSASARWAPPAAS